MHFTSLQMICMCVSVLQPTIDMYMYCIVCTWADNWYVHVHVCVCCTVHTWFDNWYVHIHLLYSVYLSLHLICTSMCMLYSVHLSRQLICTCTWAYTWHVCVYCVVIHNSNIDLDSNSNSNSNLLGYSNSNILHWSQR